MDRYNPRHLVLFGIVQIDQMKIALPNVSQPKCDELSKELNKTIRGIVDAFAKAYSHDIHSPLS